MKMTLGIAWLLSGYLFLSLAFVILVGILSISYLVSSMINQRMKDIAIIKAAGCLPRRLLSYSLAEASVVILCSCLAGALTALLIYSSWSGFLQQFNPTGALIIVGVPGVFFFTSYLAASFQMGRILNTTSLNAISSQLSTLDLKRLGKPLRVKRLGSAFNLATRTVLRDRQFASTLIRVSVCIFLVTVVLTGALVSWDTSKSYVERAMPPQVLMVGTSTMVDQYAQLGLSFSSTESVQFLSDLKESHVIDAGVAEAFEQIPGVRIVDTRVIVVSQVSGYVRGQVIEGQLIPPVYTGSAQVLIVGVDSNRTVGEWFTSDGFLESSDPQNTLVVGDSLVGSIIRQPLKLSEVQALGVRFEVKGAIVDPLNQGRVVYAPIEYVQEILGIHGYDILLLKVNDDPTMFSKVQQMAGENGLAVRSQDPVLSTNLAFLDYTWSYLSILPILTLVLTAGVLLSYLTTNFSRRFNDYIVLKVLGARGWYILKLLLWESFGFLVICMALAFPLTFIFSTILLVPEPEIVAGNLSLSALVSASALTVVCIASATIYSKKLGPTTVKELRL